MCFNSLLHRHLINTKDAIDESPCREIARIIAVTQLNILQGLVCEEQFSVKDIVAQNIVKRFNPLLQRHSIKITDTYNRPSRKSERNSSGATNIREEEICVKKIMGY